MDKIFILVLGILKMTSYVICNKYDLQVNKIVNSTLDQLWLIQSNRKLSKVKCLADCNLNDECYTARFIPDSLENYNCFLYNKYFDPIEIMSSLNSNLYIKHCKPVRTLDDTSCIYKSKLFFNLIYKLINSIHANFFGKFV
jgi:hypothetical protein